MKSARLLHPPQDPRRFATRWSPLAARASFHRSTTTLFRAIWSACTDIDGLASRPSLRQELRISPDAGIVDRVASSGIPVLDSHQQTGVSNALGRITKVWFAQNALMAPSPSTTPRKAARPRAWLPGGEIAGISAGYTIHEWEITDAKGTCSTRGPADQLRRRFDVHGDALGAARMLAGVGSGR